MQQDTPKAIGQETRVRDIVSKDHFEPILVRQATLLTDLPPLMAQNAACHTIGVVDSAGTLIGIVPVDSVVQSLLVHVMPMEFISDVFEPGRAAELAREQHARTAGDLMQPVLPISLEDPVSDAFRKLHEAGLHGTPVTDEEQHVVGYIGLLQVLLFGLRQ